MRERATANSPPAPAVRSAEAARLPRHSVVSLRGSTSFYLGVLLFLFFLFFFRLYLFLRREPRSRGLGRFDTVTMTTLSRSAGSRNYRSTRKRRKKLRWRKGTLPLARLPACLPSFLPACVPILEFRGGRLPCQRAGWPGGRSVQVMGEGAAKRREKARSLSLVVVGLCPSPGGILQRKNLPLDF